MHFFHKSPLSLIYSVNFDEKSAQKKVPDPYHCKKQIVMDKYYIKVPVGISGYKLSNWPDFPSQFNPMHQKYILDKSIPGCGATTYYLENDQPLILCSHRTLLLKSKADSPRHIGKVHLFKQPDDSTRDDLQANIAKLHYYLNNCKPSPFSSGSIPKILVTIDSLPHVFDVLTKRNELQYFTLVSDECQCLITDAPFKEESLLNYTLCLNYLQRVIYLSATPLDKYLEQIPPLYSDIGQLPYYKLVWPEEAVESPNVRVYEVKSLRTQINAIIRDYKKNGYFVQDYHHQATQAVFFCNSVQFINTAIVENHLDPAECNIICADNPKNRVYLDKGKKLTVGTAPKEGEPHKTYTFVTKCSFEGVDFYHTNAMTYIFADPNLDNMLVDISNEIPQILGRQRLPASINHWKNCAIIFTRVPDGSSPTEKEFKQHIQAKMEFTEAKIIVYNQGNDNVKMNMIDENHSIKKVDGYKRDYLQFATDPRTRQTIPLPNFLVQLCEQRAWDIRTSGYMNNLHMLSEGGSAVNSDVARMEYIAQKTGSFEDKMKAYVELLCSHPELQEALQGSVFIDPKYHEYYAELGQDKIRTLSYHESSIKMEIASRRALPSIEDEIRGAFHVGEEVSNKTAKQKLQEIYDRLGVHNTAKATDLRQYFTLKKTNIKEDGQRVHGIKIISYI